ncbi:hypothetical protein Tco_0896556 [Tanacetum coccineum]
MLCAYDCYVNDMKLVELLQLVGFRRTYTFTVLSQVMSTLAHIDSETISQTDIARRSRVPVPLPDNPYMAVSETKIPQPLPFAPSPVPPSDDPYLIVSQAHTPATIDTESEPEEAPSETKEFEASKPSNTRITSPHSTAPSDSITLTARMAVRTQPTLSPGMSARIAEVAALSPSSFQEVLGTTELVEDTKDESSDSDTEGEGSKEEEELALGEGSVPSTFEIRQSSRSMSKQQRVEETPTPRPGLRSMEQEQEQERATVTFSAIWRPVLALESWARHVDAQRVEMWRARYDDHRLIYDLLVQNTTMQCELQEIRDRVTILEREGSRR